MSAITPQPRITFLGDKDGSLAKKLVIGNATLDRLGVEECLVFPHPPFSRDDETLAVPQVKILIKCRRGFKTLPTEGHLQDHIREHFNMTSSVTAIGSSTHRSLDSAVSAELITDAEYTKGVALIDDWKKQSDRVPEFVGR